MMTNLFSMFDPSTPTPLSSNWIAIFIVLALLPVLLWLSPSRTNQMNKLMHMFILTEFSPLIKKSPYLSLNILSFFIMILAANLTGLLPYVLTISSHLAFSLSLALPGWLAVITFSWLMSTSNTLVHLIPQGTPLALAPFMVLIETVSNLIRPGTLAVRLAANMIAGHLLITILSSAFTACPVMGLPILMTAQVALSLLELAVAMIQAYVFSVLITLYAAEANS